MLVGRRGRVEMRAGELAMSHWRGRIAPGRRSSALRLAKPAPGPTTSHLSTLLPANHASSPLTRDCAVCLPSFLCPERVDKAALLLIAASFHLAL